MENSSQEASDALFEAGALIDSTGWCRNALVNTDGKHCAMGALNTVTSGTYHYPRKEAATETYKIAVKALAARARGNSTIVGNYNGPWLAKALGWDDELSADVDYLVVYNNNVVSSQAEISDMFKEAAKDIANGGNE